jgi:hypothetical protein
LIFKEWYLQEFGDTANQPGRLMATILNMGDRYTGAAELQPYPGWGLGRFRLFDVPSSATARTGARQFGTARGDLGARDFLLLDVNEEGTGCLPARLARFRAVGWWDEPNTAGGSKALMYLYLYVNGRLIGVANNDNGSGGEHLVSLAFDNDDPRMPCIEPGDNAFLVLLAVEAPSAFAAHQGAVDPGFEPFGRESYVSWFWECGADESEISCSRFDVAHVACDGRLSNADRADWVVGANP